MTDRKTIMSWLEGLAEPDWRMFHSDSEVQNIAKETLELLKEQEKLLRKLQNDKDKLCLEVSEWKHKFHDTPSKFVSQGVVDQIRWERDTALSQLQQIGKGLGSKMDDIVALLKKQEAKTGHWVLDDEDTNAWECSECGALQIIIDGTPLDNSWFFCPHCGARLEWR